MTMQTALHAFLDAASALLGSRLLTQPEQTQPYARDWRGKYQGRPLAVAFPQSTEEVSALVRLAVAHQVAVVPQGGNTGLSGGATPDASGEQLILNLSRMNRIRARDAVNKTLTVEAGLTLEAAQQAADEMGLFFPLDLTARGTATIGGNLATNAGGTAVLRYGNARALCLGLEVVTATGEVWSGLRGLRKDNTGYDLRDLFIGSEGTLGIITAAVLALHPRPAGVCTALVAVPDLAAALKVFQIAQRHCDAALTACEVMTPPALALVAQHLPDSYKACVAGQETDTLVLLEVSHAGSEEEARTLLEQALETLLANGPATDAVVAQNLSQAQALWRLREDITLAAAEDGPQVKCDIALPISQLADFCEATQKRLGLTHPGLRFSNFGHLGDGNLHFNIAPPTALALNNLQQPLDRADRHAAFRTYLDTHEEPIRRIVHDEVAARGGSISAEHGLGQLRRDEAARLKSPVELSLLRQIKEALDPDWRLNPNKVLGVP